jgi:hypothetical protein
MRYDKCDMENGFLLFLPTVSGDSDTNLIGAPLIGASLE